MKRTPLRRTGPPKRRARLGPSKRRKPQRDAAWLAGQIALRRDRFKCQANDPSHVECFGPIDPHHIAPRSTRPDLAANVGNIIAVCRTAHLWIDANPAAANARGMHHYAWEDPMPHETDRLIITTADGGIVEHPCPPDPAEITRIARRIMPVLPTGVVWTFARAGERT